MPDRHQKRFYLHSARLLKHWFSGKYECARSHCQLTSAETPRKPPHNAGCSTLIDQLLCKPIQGKIKIQTKLLTMIYRNELFFSGYREQMHSFLCATEQQKESENKYSGSCGKLRISLPEFQFLYARQACSSKSGFHHPRYRTAHPAPAQPHRRSV